MTIEIDDLKGTSNTSYIGSTTSKSCIQIIPRPNQKTTRDYKLRIKDPSFSTIFKKGYSFYFGRVQVHALIECRSSKVLENEWSFDTQQLCKAENAKSQTLDVGILNPKASNISSISIGKSSRKRPHMNN